MQPELTPLSLGELLRRAREARGLTVSRVESETRIRRTYLDALERNDLSALPAPVFTRGLVRSYALHLGVDPIEAIELLHKEEARLEQVGVRPTSNPPPMSPPLLARAVWGAVVLVALGVVVGLLYLGLPTYKSLFAATTARAQATAAPTQEPLPTPTVPPAPTARPTASPAPTAPPSPTALPTATMNAEARTTATVAAGVRGVTIEARASGRVWSQVESDGQVVYSGILMAGEKKTWKAEKAIVMHVGDAALIDVTFNGRLLGPVGAAGEVVKAEWLATR